MQWRRAGTLDDARAARPWLAITIDGLDLVVASVDGTWYGLEDRCSHAGCAFSEDAELDGFDVICSCHGSEFDIRTGAVLRGPAEQAVRTFGVRVSGERLEVDL